MAVLRPGWAPRESRLLGRLSESQLCSRAFAADRLVRAARVVLEPELAALERRGRHGVERRARRPCRDRGEAEALRRFAHVQVLVLRELVEPLRERAEVLLEQAAAGIFNESLHERERLQLVRREPEARQLERFARLGLAVLVAAGVRVEDDGRVQVVLQRVDRAMQRALRAFESRRQILERDRRAPRREDGVELENSVELIHSFLLLFSSCIHCASGGQVVNPWRPLKRDAVPKRDTARLLTWAFGTRYEESTQCGPFQVACATPFGVSMPSYTSRQCGMKTTAYFELIRRRPDRA